jgi:hypothetical protein
LPEGETDSEGEAGRFSLQGVRIRDEEKEEDLLSEEGEERVASYLLVPLICFDAANRPSLC